MLKRIDNPEAKEMCRQHITYNNDSRKPVRNRKNSALLGRNANGQST